MPTPAEIQRLRELLPTTLGSEELRAIPAEILRRSVFSARMTSVAYLAKVRDVCNLISDGIINSAEAEEQLLRVLEEMGHSPLDGGGLKNPASIRRINLIIDTQRQMAASVARIANETEVSRHEYPAWELTRISPRMVPRIDWHQRWNLASSSVGFDGVARGTTRMVALKSSPVWQALGDGTGGFKDTLRNPYPPFAYSSGLGWIRVSRKECETLGMELGEDVRFERPSLAPDKMTVKEAVELYGIPELSEGLL